MLAKARQVLVGELALAENVDEKKADELDAQMLATLERQKSEGVAEEPKPELADDVDLDDLDFDD